MLKISFEITGINYILNYKTVILNSTNILKCYSFCCILDQINAGLVIRRDFLLFENF